MEPLCKVVNKGPGDLTYKTAHIACRFVTLKLLRTSVVGIENIPAGGPAILACNHVSYLDPPLLGSVVTRPVRFLGKHELFTIPALGAFLRSVQCLPVRRGSLDIRAVRASLAVLRRGEVLGIFPEGTRYKSPGLRSFFHGVGWLAIKERAPVIPTVIEGYVNVGRTDWTRPGRMRITFGEPVVFSEREFPSAGRPHRRSATELIYGRIASLLSHDGPRADVLSEPV